MAATQALLAAASERLAAVSDSPRAEAERLLALALGVPRTHIVAGLAPAPEPGQAAVFERTLARRAAGEPYAYIVGEQPFHGIELRVTPEVLIPRPDTEHLVDWALELLRARAEGATVWDVATGSGCVALAIASAAPAAAMLASDISATALAVARDNAARLGCRAVEFAHCDALQLPDPRRRFDLIVSNPPYIAADDPHLPALAHEPRLALVSGVDGLDCLRRLIVQAPARLESGGWLLLEHGYDQGAAVRALLAQAGFAEVGTRRDYGGNERVSGGRRP
ncbi:MAG: peptide chain release factor N(5)-glutamine methyltransferase [Stagnimonas sp.]|nr:peptide chain release factor N(5)-glutamine methyltransferase [Stagnimonas sp.]